MRVAHDGVYGVVLMQVLHLQDAFLWLVCYYAATVLLLVTVLTLSALPCWRHLAGLELTWVPAWRVM